jgi:type VI secretion system secreted protein VgrG
MQAQADALTAYNTIAALPVTETLTGQDLGGLTLTSGVYFFSSAAFLTTGTLTLTLKGTGPFYFQIGSTLITASGSAVDLIDGASAGDVYWDVGSSATLGTATAFEGNILAYASITLATGATILDGRAIALNGAVTMDTNAVTIPATIPEPSTWAMMLIGFAGLGFAGTRRTKPGAVFAAA